MDTFETDWRFNDFLLFWFQDLVPSFEKVSAFIWRLRKGSGCVRSRIWDPDMKDLCALGLGVFYEMCNSAESEFCV